jgi:hypothetical protein
MGSGHALCAGNHDAAFLRIGIMMSSAGSCFIAKDNEAHRLTFEILSQKLDLFG